MKKNILNGLTIFIVIILLSSVSTLTFAISKEENEQKERLGMVHYNVETGEITTEYFPSADEILSEAKAKSNNNMTQITIDENGGRIEPYIADAESLVMPTEVFDVDNRELIPDTTQYPYCDICQLEITFPSKVQYGTGVLIHKKTLLTARHCFFDNETGEYAKAITVNPARNGSDLPYGQTYVANYYVDSNFVNGDILQDWAIAELYDEIGLTTGWMGVAYSDDYSYFVEDGLSVSVTGYPYGLKEENNNNYMYTDREKVEEATIGNLSFKTDASGGESGAPVYEQPKYCIGIYARAIYKEEDTGNIPIVNVCTNINKNRFALIVKWINERG